MTHKNTSFLYFYVYCIHIIYLVILGLPVWARARREFQKMVLMSHLGGYTSSCGLSKAGNKNRLLGWAGVGGGRREQDRVGFHPPLSSTGIPIIRSFPLTLTITSTLKHLIITYGLQQTLSYLYIRGKPGPKP